MNTIKPSDFAESTKLSLSTFLNIAQMARYRYQYSFEKELQNDSHVLVNGCELARNRNKMIYHTCLAGLGIIELFAIGVSGFKKK